MTKKKNAADFGIGVDDAVIVISPEEGGESYGLSFMAPKSLDEEQEAPVHLVMAAQIVHFISNEDNLKIINDYFQKSIEASEEAENVTD